MHMLTKLILSNLDSGKNDNGAHSGAHRMASDQPVIIPDWIDIRPNFLVTRTALFLNCNRRRRRGTPAAERD
jgi:hypothetical protein